MSAYYHSLPLYQLIQRLLIRNHLLSKHFDKSLRHSLGLELINLSWQLMDNFVIASNSTDKHQKKVAIHNLNLTHLKLKERYRLILELDVLSLRQQAIVNDLMIEIGKMIGSWLKKTT